MQAKETMFEFRSPGCGRPSAWRGKEQPPCPLPCRRSQVRLGRRRYASRLVLPLPPQAGGGRALISFHVLFARKV